MVTLSDVAKAAGVSLATASRALHGSQGRSVRPELAQRVMDAARDLGYTPDANAQAMARRSTTWLGLSLGDLTDPYFAGLAAGVSEVAGAAGLMVTLAVTAGSLVEETRFVEMMHRQRARAIVLAGGRQVDMPGNQSLEAALTGFVADGGTAAVVGAPLAGCPAVTVDNAGGGAAMARALYQQGYRRFTVLAGPPERAAAAQRAQGFIDELAQLGCRVEPADVIPCGFSRDEGYRAFAQVAPALVPDAVPGGHRLRRAVFAVGDVMAVGAMVAARDAGLEVPQDVAIAGFDDVATLRDITPALTTVHVPLRELGRRVAELAIYPDSGAGPFPEVLPTEVVLRASS